VSERVKGRYYFRVPQELQRVLLQDLRRLRRRSAILYFPILVLIGTPLIILAVLMKGHAILHWARKIAGPEVTDRSVWLALTAMAVVVAAVGIMIVLWLMYRERPDEEHLFCKDCLAVDSDDEGVCPVCQRSLSARGHFIYTLYDDEVKMLSRRGLEGWRGA
jgi:hypothetical protein